MSSNSYVFKMILLGESGSGKTSLFNRIIYNTPEGTQEPNERTGYLETSMCHSRYENCTKDIQVLGKNGNTTVNVTVFDTGGEERVNYMTLNYYNDAQIVCFVYALDSLVSFTSLNAWFTDAQDYLAIKAQHSIAKPVYALVGIKGDIPLDEREVKLEDVERAAKHFKIPEDCCFEVSNTAGDSVAEMMRILAQKAYNLHTLPTSIGLQSYSLVPASLGATDQPVRKSKQRSTFSLCCFKTREPDYETLHSM